MKNEALKKGNNKGFTLAEMLVVLSLAFLIIVTLLISYSIVSNANVVKAANRLESVLRSARTSAMSMGADRGVVNIVPEGGLVYAEYETGSGVHRELICGAGLKMQSGYVENIAAAPTLTDGGGYVVFNTNGRLKTKGVTKTTANYFLISRGKKVYKVVAYIETGAVESGLYDPIEEGEGGEGDGT